MKKRLLFFDVEAIVDNRLIDNGPMGRGSRGRQEAMSAKKAKGKVLRGDDKRDHPDFLVVRGTDQLAYINAEAMIKYQRKSGGYSSWKIVPFVNGGCLYLIAQK